MLRASARASVRAVRAFHVTRVSNAASIFRMPAMSPTMTEGGIVSWKYKAGDAFTAGDVLLEVETDKATIDVEALDDGVMWEILRNDGDKGIPVGEPIAFFAEEGDDLATLEKPKDDQAPSSSASTSAPEPEQPAKKETKKEVKEESTSTSSNKDVFNTANPNQKLSPAVELLLHEHHISKEDAFSKIEASGPKGRILKGDVLAYLGEIKTESVSKIAEWIKSKEHMDLSNIILARPEESKKEGSVEEAVVAPPKPTNIVEFKLNKELNSKIEEAGEYPEVFRLLISLVENETYAARFPEYELSPTASPYVTTDLFDDLITPSVTEKRFEITDVKFDFFGGMKVGMTTSSVVEDDFLDIIGNTSEPGFITRGGNPTHVNIGLKLKINEKLPDAKEFVTLFEQNLREIIEA